MLSRVPLVDVRTDSAPGGRLGDAYELSLGAFRLVVIYLGFAGLWIIGSDMAVRLLVDDESVRGVVESAKGIAFVCVTATLLYFLVRRDVQVIRNAEAELLAANARLDELADFPRLSPAPILRLGLNGSIEHANTAALVAASDTNREIAALLPAGIGETCAQALRTGELPEQIEVQVGRRWFRWFLFPVSQRQCVYAYGVDCTAEHDFQAHLIQTEKLEIAGRLTAGLAHDFGNYVAAIKGHADLLLDELSLDSPVREDIETIDEVAGRAAMMVRRLMSLGRDDASGVAFDLRDNVLGMEALLRLLLRPGVQLNVVAADGPFLVGIDAGQFGRVLANLVVNAGDAIDGDGVVRISMDRSGDATRVIVRVSDTGHGMDAGTLSRVWEPFFTTKDPGKGTGLGLPMAKEFIEAAGGSIEVQSVLDQGTTFVISLPIDVDGQAPS